MNDARGIVIVGAGLAGAKTAEALRAGGYDGSLVLVGGEWHLPYERPPLSKGYLLGKAKRDSVFVHDADYYADHRVEYLPGTTAQNIDRADGVVQLDNGRRLHCDRIALATGASPIRLDIAGADADRVHYLRTLDDSDTLRAALMPDARIVVIGGGWIGLEVAAAARQAGGHVTIIEALELPLLRVLGPEMARVFTQLHQDHGVVIRANSQVRRIITSDGSATGVELADGETVAADAVVVAVGVRPNIELAAGAGLELRNGVVTDQHLTTSDPHIVAVGDIANAYHPVIADHIRVEHWANALKQPATAAATMLGEDASYTELPYFYTDQYDLGMEYVGYAPPGSYDDVVIRGDLSRREFIAFWMSGDRCIAGMNVNVWDVVEDVKAVIAGGSVDKARLADTGIALADVPAA